MPATTQTDRINSEGMVSNGTCFLVSPNGIAITSHHVIDGAKTISVTLSDGKQVPALVESFSAAIDVAVLRSDHERIYYQENNEAYSDAHRKSIVKQLEKIETLRAPWDAKTEDEIIDEYRAKYT